MNQQFVESLIAIKDHYRALQKEIERDQADAEEQIVHVNALLVERIEEVQRFVESLVEMRSHYQGIIDECERRIAHTTEQITHTDALLAAQLGGQFNQSLHREQLFISPILSLPTADTNTQEFSHQKDKTDPASVSGQDEISLAHQVAKVEPHSVEESRPLSPEILVTQSKPEQSSAANVSLNEHAPKSLASGLKAPMLLPEYRQLNLLQAVERILSESAGSILDINYIISTLYGQLEANTIGSETIAILDILNRGADEGVWDKIPNQSSCYTLDLKLLTPELAAQANQQQHSGKQPQSPLRRNLAIKPLPSYQHLSLTDAIAAILEESGTTPLKIDAVTQKLFGSLDAKAKKSVSDLLVKGVHKKRWQRAPGREGRYMARPKP